VLICAPQKDGLRFILDLFSRIGHVFSCLEPVSTDSAVIFFYFFPRPTLECRCSRAVSKNCGPPVFLVNSCSNPGSSPSQTCSPRFFLIGNLCQNRNLLISNSGLSLAFGSPLRVISSVRIHYPSHSIHVSFPRLFPLSSTCELPSNRTSLFFKTFTFPTGVAISCTACFVFRRNFCLSSERSIPPLSMNF